jgi:small subunit ribosomal protein S6
MQNYEIALIINPDLSKDIDKFFISFEKLLSDNSFSISRLEDVGRRKLAYTIDDHNKGHYLFYYVQGNPVSVSKIEDKIKFNDMIIRYLFFKINNIPDSDSFLNEDIKKEEDKPKKELKDSKSKKVSVTKTVQDKKTGEEIVQDKKVTNDRPIDSEKEEIKDE